MANRIMRVITWGKKSIILGLINASLFILLSLWILLFGFGPSDSGGVFACAIFLKFLNYPVFIMLDDFNITRILNLINKDAGFALFFFIFAFFSFFYWFAIGILLKVAFPFIARAFRTITNGYRVLVTILEKKAYGDELHK